MKTNIVNRICFLIVVLYVSVIYYTTIFSRKELSEYKYNYQLFWSYLADGQGSYYFKENFLNILIFIPIGMILPYVIKSCKLWYVILVGLTISIPIEVLQLILKRGFSELDDIFHNTLGVVVGFLLIKGIVTVYKESKQT